MHGQWMYSSQIVQSIYMIGRTRILYDDKKIIVDYVTPTAWVPKPISRAPTLTWLVDLSQKSLLTLNSYGQLLLNNDVPGAIVFIISILQIFSWK